MSLQRVVAWKQNSPTPSCENGTEIPVAGLQTVAARTFCGAEKLKTATKRKDNIVSASTMRFSLDVFIFYSL
jgi:hypothetical protein